MQKKILFNFCAIALLGLAAIPGGAQAATLPAPQIILPVNNATTTISDFTLVDWTDATSTVAVTYQLELYYNNAYKTATSSIDGIVGSQKSVNNITNGTYYLRVRAKDASGNISDWSNNVKNPYRVTVGSASSATDPANIAQILTDKNKCKNDGWRTIFNFKNQGNCVAYYNQMIMGHIQNLLNLIKEKQKQLQAEIQKRAGSKAVPAGYQNYGQYNQSQKNATTTAETATGNQGNGNGNSNSDGNKNKDK